MYKGLIVRINDFMRKIHLIVIHCSATRADKEVLKDTLKWLDSRGMKNAVSMQMVEQYAFSVARWIHLERLISKYGYIAKHPTTGAPIQSPYVAMAQSYMKQVIAIRSEINLQLKESRPAPTTYVREVVYGE